MPAAITSMKMTWGRLSRGRARKVFDSDDFLAIVNILASNLRRCNRL
jgi:hypothetical protein